jgi:Tol biopolymer transport system component
MSTKRLLAAVLFLAFLAPFASPSRAQSQVQTAPTYAEPSLSPDHSEIAFVFEGDVWSVPSGGGTARLLAAVGGTAARPLWSPDGKRVAFVSTRTGASGVFVLTLDGGELNRLTHDDAAVQLEAWSPDSRSVYFSTNARNISSSSDVFRVAVDGGTPMPVLDERYVNKMDAAPAPDGHALAFVRNGFGQWWRRGHSHMDQSEIMVEHLDARTFDTITNGDSKDRWPMWSPDGHTLYWVSDRDGNDQLWARTDAQTPRKLTSLQGDRVLWPAISHDGRLITFEREMSIWTYDTSGGQVHKLDIAPRGIRTPGVAEHVTLNSFFSNLDLSPDGKKVAFAARGQIFAASSREGGVAQLVTHGNNAYDVPVWAPDSRRVAYVIDRGTTQAIAIHDFGGNAERIVTPDGHHDDYPKFSPDGKTLIFVRDGRELHSLDLETHADVVLAHGILERRPFGSRDNIAFSPAGDWIAYVDQDKNGFANVRAVRTSGGSSIAITSMPNANGGPLAWSTDGTRIYFLASQRTEPAVVAQIDLIPRTPHFKEDAFRDLFIELPSRTGPAPAASPGPQAPASAKPAARRTTIETEGIRDRVTLIPTGLDVESLHVTPDGKTLVFGARVAGLDNLYAYSIDDIARDSVARQLTTSAGRKTSISIFPDGKEAAYLDSGRASIVAIDGRTPAHALPLSAELDIDFQRDKAIVFAQAWSTLDRWYADPSFHGADWAAVRRTYEPHALGAQTPEEFRRILSLMIGEMNSSHSGIFAPPSPASPSTPARLGLRWDPAAYAQTGRLRVAEVIPLGPAAVSGKIAVGDELLAVEGTPLDAHVDLDALLLNRVGKRTELRIAPQGNVAAARSVPVLPVDRSTEKTLLYNAWVVSRRAYVEKESGGRIGYVHLYDMGSGSLEKFYRDLDVQNRERAGVVIDIRNNNGGFVDPYALDVLSRREFLKFVSRFGTDPPERTSLGQRALDRPTILVVNEHTLSDGENFTEGYRRLGLGKVVGVPTAGWIIFTSGIGLLDGSNLRLPTTRVITEGGIDMELHPRPVDIRVDVTPADSARGRDPQLDAAVRELTRQLDRAR